MKKLITNLVLVAAFFLVMNANSIGQTHIWGTCDDGGITNGGTIFTVDGNGNNLNTVYSYDNSNAMYPLANMVLAPNGKIYGIICIDNCGTTRELNEYDPVTHTNHIVYNFGMYNPIPDDGMILGTDGNLYGTTIFGESNDFGSIYRFNPNTYAFDTIHNFDFYSGSQPHGRLLQINNKLYGYTNQGGVYNRGVIFCLDLSTLNYTDLYDFNIGTGVNPIWGSLILANDGKLYGTTQFYAMGNPNGVIYSYDISANQYSVVHYFDYLHGGSPEASLIQATDGKLYGMTRIGGLDSVSVIFSYDISDSIYTDLYDFDKTHGANPFRELMQASNGLIFGVTVNGGTYNKGVLFSYNISSNAYNVLFNFDGGHDGSQPDCDLVELPDNLTNGIKTINKNEEISFYPNPASSTITISQSTPSPNQQLLITNILGEEIYHQTINNTTQTTIDVSRWSNGVYFYQIRGDKETLQGKFVKQ